MGPGPFSDVHSAERSKRVDEAGVLLPISKPNNNDRRKNIVLQESTCTRYQNPSHVDRRVLHASNAYQQDCYLPQGIPDFEEFAKMKSLNSRNRWRPSPDECTAPRCP